MVALVGSRHLQASQLVKPITAIMRALSGRSGCITGCCPTGADLAAKLSAQSLGWSILHVTAGGIMPPKQHNQLVIVHAQQQTPAALRFRTIQVIAAASEVFCWARSAIFPHSGSWLSIFQAALLNKPVYVSCPGNPAAFPKCHNIIGWQSFPCSGLFGGNVVQGLQLYTPLRQAVQTRLFPL